MVFLNINDRSIYTSFCDFVNKVTAFVSVQLCLLCTACVYYTLLQKCSLCCCSSDTLWARWLNHDGRCGCDQEVLWNWLMPNRKSLGHLFWFSLKIKSPCFIRNLFCKMFGLPLALSWGAYYSRSCFYHKCYRENSQGGWESYVDLGEVRWRESVWAEHCLSCPSWGSRVSSHLDERKTQLCTSPNAPLWGAGEIDVPDLKIFNICFDVRLWWFWGKGFLNINTWFLVCFWWFLSAIIVMYILVSVIENPHPLSCKLFSVSKICVITF